jgi:hypothetical protein
MASLVGANYDIPTDEEESSAALQVTPATTVIAAPDVNIEV